MIYFSVQQFSVCLITVAFHSSKGILDIPFLVHQVFIQSSIPSTIIVSAFSKSIHLLSLDYGPLQKILCNLLSDTTQRSTVIMLPWWLSTYCDPFQFHGKSSGFSKAASTLILDTKVLKLNFLLHVSFVRL